MAASNNQDDQELKQELKEKLYEAVLEFQEDVNSQEYNNVTHALYKVNMSADSLYFKLNFEVDQFSFNKIKEDDMKIAVANSEDVNENKVEMLLRLQTLTSEITCHIVEDFKKILDRKKSCSDCSSNN